MIVRFSIFLLFLLPASSFLFAQDDSILDSIEVYFVFELDGTQLVLGESVVYKEGAEMVSIDQLRFYISNLQWEDSAAELIAPEKSYHLVDAAVPTSQRLTLPTSASMTSLHFGFGVDSLTNDAGVHGGDLDPTVGMYWAWQSGYINFKLEGRSEDACDEFTYHLGGFLNGLDASTNVTVPLENWSDDTKELELVFELGNFLEFAKQTAGCKVMRPSKEAVELATAFEKSLTLHN